MNVMSEISVKSKFRCSQVTDNGVSKTAKLSAIYGSEGENADYAKATPWGIVEIQIDKETKASDFFVPQKDYYLTFNEA